MPFPSPFPEHAPLPDRGLYTLGYDDDGVIKGLPYIKGGRILLQWADLETGEGRYDFSALDHALEEFRADGRKAAVQVNGGRKPRWLFQRVAVLPVKEIQVKDPEGTLQYWDPIYVNAWLQFIRAFGDHLRGSPLRTAVLGVRQNFNAVGTEHGSFARAERGLKIEDWKPAPNGHLYRVPWTEEIYQDYRRRVIAAHIAAFVPGITLFLRNNVFVDNILTASQLKLLDDGIVGLFHTSSEHQPRNSEPKYQAFLDYCRTGLAPGYTEPFTTNEQGFTGAPRQQHLPSRVSPSQYNYWRLLLDMNCGISYIALKGSDILLEKNPEFRDAFLFAAKYVGYHASPSVSPGAWVAMREGDALKGDYTFLMQRVDASSTDVALNDQGPPRQRFGGWARAIDTGGRMTFQLDPRFARSLKNARIRIVYLDDGTNDFVVSWGEPGASHRKTVTKHDSRQWQEVLVDAPNPGFTGAADPGDISLSASGRTVFHLVEVQRVEG